MLPRDLTRWVVLATGIIAGITGGAVPPPAGATTESGSVFVVVTVDKSTWEPYEYGSAFFFNGRGDAYTASHVVADAVKNPDLRLAAIVNGVEYIARAICWNPESQDRANTYSRDVAVIHVGPEVPLFPIGHYPPATTRLISRPLPVRRGGEPGVGQTVQVMGFGEHRAGPVFVERGRRGRMMRLEQAQDGTPIARIQFPVNAAPSDGDSGGPIEDDSRTIVGIANWTRAHPLTPGTVEMDGVAATSLGCVVRVPPERNRLDPFNTPLQMP
ncbi:MAG TPA: serine protease [bacterium]|nr:serine protease [bacterium]